MARFALPQGGFLAADFRPVAKRSEFAVVWIHGFGSHRGGKKSAALKAECRRRGWAFLGFDFRGHGESSGEMRELSPQQLMEDLDAVRHWLAGRGHTRLGLVGSSMGGFAAAWFAQRRPESVIGCVFIAPAFRFLERRWQSLSAEDRLRLRRSSSIRIRNEWIAVEISKALFEQRAAFRFEKLVLDWRTPSLVFHGCADNVVPVADSLDFLAAVNHPKIEVRLWKDGDHRLTSYKREIASGACEFFAQL